MVDKVLTPEQVAMEQKQLEVWLVNKHDLITMESLVAALARALESHEALRAQLALTVHDKEVATEHLHQMLGRAQRAAAVAEGERDAALARERALKGR